MLKSNSAFSIFFNKERHQIYFQNIKVIRGLSLFYLISLLLFTGLGFFIFDLSDRFITLLILYGTMILLMLILFIFSGYIEKHKMKELKLSLFMTYLSMFISMTFIIIVSTLIARIETRASFFLVFNILLPSLYMLNKKQIILSEIIAVIFFLAFSYFFRELSFKDDLYLGLASLIIGIPYNLMIYYIKMGDAYSKKQYSDQANLDTLTGIPNRRAFNSRMENLFLEGDYKSMTFIVIDADNFKQINDRKGHAYGDYAIKEMARVLKQFSDENQLFVSRIGGDEFIIIGLDIQVIKVEPLLQQISIAVKDVKLEKDEKLDISIGAFYFNQPNKYTPEEVFARADEALYIVKENKKGEIKLIVDGTEMN